jgi:hypothetical protein
LSLEQLHVVLLSAVNQNRDFPPAERADIGDGQRQQSSGGRVGGVPAISQNLVPAAVAAGLPETTTP